MKTLITFFKNINHKKILLLIASPLILLWQSMGEMILSLGFLITIDLITGIRVYLKENNLKMTFFNPSTWKNIESNGLKKTASKAKDYSLLVAAVFVVNHYMLDNAFTIFSFSIDKITVLLLAVIELWSIGENFRKIRGFNVFEYLINLIKNKDIKKTLDEVKNAEKDGEDK